MFLQKRFSALSLALIASASVYANNAYENDELGGYYAENELVTIATGTQRSLRQAPSSASVISAEQIQAMGVTNLREVLERIPGLHVMPSDLSRMDSVYSIRGIETGFNPQVLIMINGTEIKQNANGGLPFTFQMPVSNISRIEVIRGPGSAVYGADAFSGAINIHTNTAAENLTGAAGVRHGAFNSTDVWARKGYMGEQMSASIAFELQRSDGDDSRMTTHDTQSDLDALFDTDASLAPGSFAKRYDTGTVQLELGWGAWQFSNWYWRQSNGGLGQGGALALDHDGYQDASQWLSQLNYQTELGKHLHFEAKGSFVRTDSDSFFNLFPAGAVLPIGPDGNAFSAPTTQVVRFPHGYIGNPKSRSETLNIDAILGYQGIENHALRLGAGWSKERVKTKEYKNYGPGVIGTPGFGSDQLTDVSDSPHVYLNNQSSQSFYLSAQDEWQISNDVAFTTGLRWDHYDDFGSSLNPRMALIWEASHNLTSKLLYGTAFRAPTFSEQHLMNNPTLIGNPDLKPEEIETLELAFDYRPSFSTDFKLNLFRYRATGLIATVPNGSQRVYQNSRDQDGYGAELEAAWRVNSKLYAYANYAYQHASDANTGKRIARVPSHTTYLDLRYTPDSSWTISAQHFWVGSRYRETGDQRSRIDDYHWVNAKLSKTIMQRQLTISLIAKNLFDSNAAEPASAQIADDYPLESRSLWAQVEMRF